MKNQQQHNLIVSILALLISFLLISQFIVNVPLNNRLRDGTINDLGRYSFTFDAYDYISENSENPIIAIGSSKMREIFDGILIGEMTQYDGDFFNLAYAGEAPYVRMIEVDSIINTKPKLVIIEFGPNSFSKLQTPVSESVKNKMSLLMSLNGESSNPSWLDNLEDEDRNILPINKFQQMEYLSSLTPKAIEKSISYEFGFEDQPYSCDFDWGSVRCVPDENSAEFENYIQYPIQFRNSLKVIKEGNAKFSLDEFYGPMLDNYLNSTYHNPEGKLNKNQIAYEFIIEKLLQNNIPVLVVSLPYNPVLMNKLPAGKWDYCNETLQNFDNKNGFNFVNYLWNVSWEEDSFNDYTHAARDAEIKFANLISVEIDNILTKNEDLELTNN